MKKIFTLAAAVLASFSLWAAYVVPTSTLTLPNFPESGWAAKVTPAVIDTTNNWYILNPYEIYQSKFAWSSTPKGGSSAVTFDSTDIFPSDDRWAPQDDKSKISIATVKGGDNDKPYYSYRVTNCEEVAIAGMTGSNMKRTIILLVYEVSNGVAASVYTDSVTFETNAITAIHSKALSASKEYLVVVTQENNGSGGSSSGNSSFCAIAFKSAPSCTDPELTVSPTEGTGFVGDPIDIAVTSKNQSKPINAAVTVDGVPGVYGTDYTFSASTGLVQATPLKAGTFVVTFSQASNGTYCAAEESATFVISEKTPVASVTIAGPAAGFVGQELTYTATAVGATAYEWYLDGNKQGSDSAKFIYTAVKGNHNIVCKARNQFNVQNEEETWVESDPIALTVTNASGTLVSFTVNSDANGAANLSGVLAADANAKVSLTKKSSSKLTVDEVEYTGFKMDKGCYAGVTLTSGSFQEGDTVSFMITTKSGTAKLYLYDDEQGTNRLDSIPFANQTGWATFVLNQATTGVYLYRSNPDVEPYNQNPYVAALKVIRPKAVISTVKALTNVKIEGTAISAEDLELLLTKTNLVLDDDYINAPEVKFFETTTITYEDDSQKVIDDSTAVTASEVDSKWQAQATINEVLYTVTVAKTASFEVTYKLGNRVLGSEFVLPNGNPAEYAQYQNQGNYATFKNWCSDAALENAVTIASAVITKDTTFYGKFDFVYASSINIEQWVLDNAVDSAHTVALLALLGTNNYASNISYKKGTNELDSLSDKTGRNEPYLGLKVKESGKLINFRLAPESIVKVKFGETKTTPKVAINGGEYTDMTLTEKVYTYTATGEDLVSIYISEANKAVVFKQIMIGEDIQDVTLPDVPTALDNTEATVKATKRIVNGQLLIEKNGVLYNAQGVVVK